MRKFVLTFAAVVGGLYFIAHTILGSSPVQRWVLGEIRGTLSRYGIELSIESIEFSAFSPKLYLNRVKITTTPKAVVHLPEPLSIDKIKIHFQPLALISREISIEEVSLFHPQIILPQADALYRRVVNLLGSTKALQVRGQGNYSLLVKKFAIVDALFDVTSANPPFAVRSRSLSAFIRHSASGQQTVSVQSNNLEVERGELLLRLTQTDIDVDVARNSLRINRALVRGGDLAVDVKGTSSLPLEPTGKSSVLRAHFEVAVPMALLEKIPELGLAPVEGLVTASGSLNLVRGNYTGDGRLGYRELSYDGYRLGRGSMGYRLDGEELVLSNLDLGYGEGRVLSDALRLTLAGRYPVEGELEVRGMTLVGLLGSLKEVSPARMNIDGRLKASGFLSGPFEIDGELESSFSEFVVLEETEGDPATGDKVLEFGDGTVRGKVGFTTERFTFEAETELLGGTGTLQGHLGFGNRGTRVKGRLEEASFDQLRHISGLSVAGTSALVAELEMVGGEVKVAGTFDIDRAQFVGLRLGDLKGQCYYQNDLLSFENLEIPSVEPIRANGFVDFRPKEVHYKFNVDVARAPMDQIFGVFDRELLTFPVPRGGEVNSRISVEGGHDGDGVEVVSSGKAKRFDWYDEKWRSADFIVTYRPEMIELNRVMLLKKSGGLEVRGFFKDDQSRLSFKSHDLRVEDFDFVKGAPVEARLDGEVSIEGDGDRLLTSGYGQLRLADLRFRGQPFEDSFIRLRPTDGGLEFLGNFFGETARGRYLRNSRPASDELLLYFRKFDLVPLLAVFMGNDVPSLVNVHASGDVSMKGDFTDWTTLTGSGQLVDLDLGLRGTPLKNTAPIQLGLANGNIEVGRFQLVGRDGEITGDLLLKQGETVSASLDAKLDLQYLQPFIPGLEYGAGKTTVALRMSGKPATYRLLGNVRLEDGILRLTGLNDEFRSTQLQMSVSQDRLNLDRLESQVNGGRLEVTGSVGIDRFTALKPRLRLIGDRVQFRFGESLSTRISGEFQMVGDRAPYKLSGDCTLVEGRLTQFAMAGGEAAVPESGPPTFEFDINCAAKRGFFVETEVMNAEFSGAAHVVGDTRNPGLLGRAEALNGFLMFRETRFDLESATVRFESARAIRPRFRVAGRALVREQRSLAPQEYQVSLQVIGVPEDYKIRLTSSPALTEGDIISLLLLGVTSQGQSQAQEGGNYVDLGTTLVGQMPLQSKLQDELGVDIKIKSQSVESLRQTTTPTAGSVAGDITVPTVQIQKEITDKTKVSFTNTLEAVPVRELRVEQILDENLTVNATAGTGTRGNTTQSTQSYGLDFRFRFQFE